MLPKIFDPAAGAQQAAFDLLQALIRRDPHVDYEAARIACRELLANSATASQAYAAAIDAEIEAIIATPVLARKFRKLPRFNRETLRAAWIRLSEADQTMWRRHYNLDGQGTATIQELAKLLDLKDSTVKSRISSTIPEILSRGMHRDHTATS